ncbi:hypothetical protein RND81_08G121200 [Saponaria officinalis]|uniref:Uncharacterized protein n=1 Tax=Saponaria officinalis TaxID=3572 RepID=A0AAW1J6R3_SAPOF
MSGCTEEMVYHGKPQTSFPFHRIELVIVRVPLHISRVHLLIFCPNVNVPSISFSFPHSIHVFCRVCLVTPSNIVIIILFHSIPPCPIMLFIILRLIRIRALVSLWK